MNSFYVYGYSLYGEMLYIGKGKGDRLFNHFADCQYGKTYWSKKLRKLIRNKTIPICGIIENSLSEQQAFDLEISLIAKYGRKDLKSGCLYNTCKGGTGSSGHKMSIEGKLKIKQSMTGRHIGNQFALGLQHTEESKQKIREAMLGRTDSENTKKKKSEALAHQIENQLWLARLWVRDKWWGQKCSISYHGDVKRQSASATHRLYRVELNGISVLRTITDFKQGSCPKEFKQFEGAVS